MKKLKCLAIIIPLLTALSLFSGCSDKNDNGSVLYYDNNSNQYIAPDEKEQIARDNAQVVEGKMAEKATVGGFDVNLMKIVTVGKRMTDTVNESKSDLLAAEFEITNNNPETLKVSSMGDFEITIDGNKTVLGSDTYAAVSAAKTINDYAALDYSIETNQTVRGYICFAIDEGWKNIKITYIPQSNEISYDELYYNLTPDNVEQP